MSSGKEFEEMTAKNDCKYYEYKSVVESYIRKNGKPSTSEQHELTSVSQF